MTDSFSPGFEARFDTICVTGACGEEWYKQRTRERFWKVAVRLHSLGMTEDEIVDTLSDLYAAVEDCFT